MISRDEALTLMKRYLKDPYSISCSIAVESIMRELAKRLNKDKELWGLAGLLHNLDYEYTLLEPEKRGNLSAQLLEGLLPENGVNAIMANNYVYTSFIPTTSLDKALIASVASVELIFYITKRLDTENIRDINMDILESKFNDPEFAKDISRNKIRLCADFGIDLDIFLTISLNSLKQISDKISF